VFIAVEGERPFGLIQRFPIGAYRDYLEELSTLCAIPAGALSIDYLIGDPRCRGRGLGAGMIAAFVAESWAACPDANDVIVPVAAGNVASWRSLEGAGFRRIAEGELTPDNPRDPRDHYVYALRRPRAQ
jgi:aminoglycoside 6'-N-acetyltransferase